ncbi:DUF2971 domain-containing protein [Cupriavidus gilardii]|uniref:DUF2971 domain-containing protein n=1 Tax=Cupriavidus gilardii TaxID=82541 RepID=UPI001ABE262C|nr:DUF2971 domain-containing protein [Cupriavidus gilardii]MBO4121101.1 DUF2971 domain-containing protein [Cupriavidus gilardii]
MFDTNSAQFELTNGIPLYKFYSLDPSRWTYFERLLLQGEIYLSHPSQFNDPFDCAPAMNSRGVTNKKEILRLFNEAGKRTPDSRETRRSKARTFASTPRKWREVLFHSKALRFIQDVGVFCMASRRDHPLMWSHYANSHRGICIEFGTKTGLFQVANKVIYSEEMPVYDLTSDDYSEYRSIYLTKAPFWSYENEYRLLCHRRDPKKLIESLKGMESDHDLMTFAARERTTGTHKISTSSIISITFGCACPEEIKAKVIALCKDAKLDIELFNARKNHRRFELAFYPY